VRPGCEPTASKRCSLESHVTVTLRGGRVAAVDASSLTTTGWRPARGPARGGGV